MHIIVEARVRVGGVVLIGDVLERVRPRTVSQPSSLSAAVFVPLGDIFGILGGVSILKTRGLDCGWEKSNFGKMAADGVLCETLVTGVFTV